MASSPEHNPVFAAADEDLDEEDEDLDESEEDDNHLPPHNSKPSHPDLHRDNNNNTTSPSNHKVTIAFAGVTNTMPTPPSASASAAKQPVPISVISMDSTPDPKRPKIETVTIDEEEKVKPLPILDERRLFQRLWTDEDEIELLQGFLNYSSQRGFVVGNSSSSSSHHHDTSVFYDQIKSKLQLDFNKNQLVDKLRRLKKKYRNVVSKIGTGKVQTFKSTHDEATFEISRRIWRGDGVQYPVGGGGGFEEEEEEETNLNQTPNNGIDLNSAEKKSSVVGRSRKRSRSVNIEENETIPQFHHRQHSDPDPGAMKLDSGSSTKMEEKWRNQRILELEVYSKRLELVQDQIKSALVGLRSVGSSVHP
ncbi:probable transcription factor At3g04930 [Impatiens glandulifera]|uniref:probable transcription factor At3g04930 n=1 Tax=Impatiens glandulifera TaxID=253017 RepID=UPI001FB15586|nr:probable transcription factor At3g04930 [Impatiens glandulifera]